MQKFLLILLVVAAIGAGVYFSTTEVTEIPVPLADAEHTGFIRLVATGEPVSIAFDVGTWLTGPEAEDAAIAAGVCTEQERGNCLPNGYYIENSDTRPVTLIVSKKAVVSMQTYRSGEPGDEETISLNEFANLINDQEAHWMQLPYSIIVEGGVVTKIEEIYIP